MCIRDSFQFHHAQTGVIENHNLHGELLGCCGNEFTEQHGQAAVTRDGNDLPARVGRLGTNALPQAIGAQAAFPGRQVISVSGDGGLSMLLGELITAAAQQLPVKVVVFNNSSLGMVKLEMLVEGLRDFAVDVPDVNYAAIAAAMGFHAVRVSDPALIADAYRAAFAHPGPALVELITDPQALSIPPKIKGGQVLGFASAMSKIVLNKGAGEAVSMARSNLRNIPRG